MVDADITSCDVNRKSRSRNGQGCGHYPIAGMDEKEMMNGERVRMFVRDGTAPRTCKRGRKNRVAFGRARSEWSEAGELRRYV